MGELLPGLLVGLGVISFCYLLIGAILASYEQTQTDEFNWKVILKWPWAIMGKKI